MLGHACYQLFIACAWKLPRNFPETTVPAVAPPLSAGYFRVAVRPSLKLVEARFRANVGCLEVLVKLP